MTLYLGNEWLCHNRALIKGGQNKLNVGLDLEDGGDEENMPPIKLDHLLHNQKLTFCALDWRYN